MGAAVDPVPMAKARGGRTSSFIRISAYLRFIRSRAYDHRNSTRFDLLHATRMDRATLFGTCDRGY